MNKKKKSNPFIAKCNKLKLTLLHIAIFSAAIKIFFQYRPASFHGNQADHKR